MMRLILITTFLYSTFFTAQAFAAVDTKVCILFNSNDDSILIDGTVDALHSDTKYMCASKDELTVFDTYEDYSNQIPKTTLKVRIFDEYQRENATLAGFPVTNILVVPYANGTDKSQGSLYLGRVFMDMTGDMIWGNQRFYYTVMSVN